MVILYKNGDVKRKSIENFKIFSMLFCIKLVEVEGQFLELSLHLLLTKYSND